MSVEHLSTTSQSLLANAINACYEATGIENAVAVELFEDTPVIDGTVSVSVDNFSIFAVGDIAVTTYEFYVDNALVSTQCIIADATGQGVLVEPEVPVNGKAEFLGWQQDGDTNYQKFGKIEVDTVNNHTVELHAKFSDVKYVYFLYEAKENADILETISGVAGDQIDTSRVDYPLSLDKHVVSWHTDIECLSPDVTTVTIGDSDVILYPKIERGYWVTFYTEGGSHIDPMFFGKGEHLVTPPNPEKAGYEFIGWYDKNGDKFEFESQEITSSMILTARYNPKMVDYTVQIVLQNPDEQSEYDPVLGGIFKLQAPSGTVLSGTDVSETDIQNCISNLTNDSYFKNGLQYFYYNEALTGSEQIEIEGDGSSVIHIYYNRHTVEMRFYLSYTDTTPYTTRSGLFDERMAESAWPLPSEEEFPGFAGWEVSKGGSRPTWNGAYRFSFVYSAEEDKFIYNLYAVGGGGLTHAIKYYAQAINPDGTVPNVGVTLDTMPTEPHVDYYSPLYPGNEGKQELIDNWSNIDFESASTSEVTNNGAWVLDGIDTYTANGTHTGIAYRHSANSIPGFTAIAIGFDLYNNVGDGTEYRMDSFKDHPNLPNSYIDYWATSKKVATGMGSEVISSKTYYHFDSDRWYAVSEPFRAYKFFGDVYVRMLRNIYNLQFIVDGVKVGDFDVYYETDLGLDKFTSISEGLTPPDGYIFGGWYTSPSLTEDTRFYLERNTMPYNDMVLYAKWTPIRVELDVHVTIDGTDEIIEGFNGFTVKYGSIVNREQVDSLKGSVNIPDNAIWYGWYEKIDIGGQKGLLVPFNFDKQLIEDLVLYPFYSYMTPVKVKYDLNGGTGSVPVDNFNYALGRGAVVLDASSIEAPEGKYFIGWNTRQDGTGRKYYPGDIAVIDLDDMTMYAQYGTEQELINLNFYANVNNEIVTEQLMPNSTVTLVNPVDANMFSGKVYYTGAVSFIGWNTKPDGTGEMFTAGQQIVVTDSGENNLYAIWEHNYTDITISTTIRSKAPENQSFVYVVMCPDGSRLKVSIDIPKGQTYGEVVIRDVIPGKYIIVNENTWDWRYTSGENTSLTEYAVTGSENSFDFYESRSFLKWMCGCLFKNRII